MKERLPKSERRAMIINTALQIVRRDGWDALTRDAVSREGRIAMGTINFAFGTMDNLRNEVIQHAIDNPSEPAMLGVIAKGLVSGNQIAKSAPEGVKRDALATLY